MTDNWRFVIFMLASSAVFAGALLFILRTRPERSFRRICVLTVVVIVGGMLLRPIRSPVCESAASH